MNKIYTIGIGYSPLDKRAQEIILKSKVILASSRLFEVFKRYEEFKKVKNKIKVINNVDGTINFIRSQISNPPSPPFVPKTFGRGMGGFIVLLASGDPMFFGIGGRLINEFGSNAVEILPDLSSIQIAFSRIKEKWNDAFLISLHGGPDPAKRRKLEYELEDVPSLLIRHNKIAILTDKVNNPSKIAKVICCSLFTVYCSLKMYVCERLGYSDEKIIKGTPAKIAKMKFREPNVVIIKSKEHRTCLPDRQAQSTDTPTHPSPLTGEGKGGGESLYSNFKFGLKENEIQHSKGLITKDEVRAITIHKLKLPQTGVFWDIGAGSGSVSIEAARLCPDLKVFAIEKDKKQIKNLRANKVKFGTANIAVIEGEAPEALRNLPAPDRIFIGGSGGRLGEIIEFINHPLASPASLSEAGRACPPGLVPKLRDGAGLPFVVINAVTIETLNEAIRSLENHGFRIEISGVLVSRSKIIGRKKHMSALNPVFIIIGEK